jgi:hypothetical protein
MMTSQSGRSVNFKCPYQANVMNTFDASRSTIGVTKGLMAGSSAYGVMVRE